MTGVVEMCMRCGRRASGCINGICRDCIDVVMAQRILKPGAIVRRGGQRGEVTHTMMSRVLVLWPGEEHPKVEAPSTLEVV